jgi:hypothetical protein
VAGLALAAALLAWPRPLTGLLALGYTAGTLGGLLISLSVDLFGFKEPISASYVTQSLAIEMITLLGWTVLVAAIPDHLPAATARRPASHSDRDTRAALRRPAHARRPS